MSAGNKKVGIIGHFGGKRQYFDGQTVKTRELTHLLEKNHELIRVDTYYNKTNRAKLMWDTLTCLCRCKNIFLLVSDGGMKFYLPFLFYASKIKKINVFHYIIGSELLNLVKSEVRMARYLNVFRVNWFEYPSGTRLLREMGVNNAETLPNFKAIVPLKIARKYQNQDGIYRFCTFSRVMEEKGITDAIEAIRQINECAGCTVATVDIFGPVEEKYKTKFELLLQENAGCAAYMGIVDSHQSVQTLQNYYALLFPTKWAGEGVPGTVVDAFAAGIPTIASDWNANREVIEHEKTGLIYPWGEAESLKDGVLWAIDHEKEMQAMRHACLQEFEKYSPETIGKVILDALSKA